MIYVYLGAASIIFLALFLRWWHGICEMNDRADELFQEYVNNKTAKQSRKETQTERYNRTKGKKP